MQTFNIDRLRDFLNPIEKQFHQAEFLYSDPIQFVHQYSDPWDQEAVGLVSALLAYGNVKQIKNSVRNLLNRITSLSNSPSQFVRSLSKPKFNRQAEDALQGFVHRFNSGPDLFALLKLLNQSWERYGSLGAHFVHSLDPKDPHIESALCRLISQWQEWQGTPPSSSFSFLISTPSQGSCCKRWCMFLRWMGRKDRIDLGLWTRSHAFAKEFSNRRHLDSKQLVMPLDTHTGRISQYLGLTVRKNLNWKAALEVTQNLKKLDPRDPTRYDFALSRLGILDLPAEFLQKTMPAGGL